MLPLYRALPPLDVSQHPIAARVRDREKFMCKAADRGTFPIPSPCFDSALHRASCTFARPLFHETSRRLRLVCCAAVQLVGPLFHTKSTTAPLQLDRQPSDFWFCVVLDPAPKWNEHGCGVWAVMLTITKSITRVGLRLLVAHKKLY